jgi:hypothetical protein
MSHLYIWISNHKSKKDNVVPGVSQIYKRGKEHSEADMLKGSMDQAEEFPVQKLVWPF